MPYKRSLKLSLYNKQKNIVLYFLVLFYIINIAYSTNYYWAALLCTFIVGLTFLSNNQFIKAKNPESGILVLLAAPILTLSFAQSIGNDAPIWMFHIVIIFQSLFLVENVKQQIVLVVLNILAGMFISYLQEQPLSNILSRGTVLGLFSIYGYNSIKTLLKSAETLQNEVENKLKLNLELFNTRAFQRQVLDSTNYAIIGLDENNTIVEFNKGAEMMLGYSALNVLGKINPVVFFDFNELERNNDIINKKYNANIKPSIETVLFKNKIGLQNTSEWILNSSNGNKITVRSTINNIKDDNGKIIGYTIVSFDITEKKRQEESQQTAETIIANSASVLIKWLPFPNRKVIYVSSNISKLLGYTSVEISQPNFNYNAHIKPSDLQKIEDLIAAATSNKTDSFNIEYRIKNKLNNWVWVEESSLIKRNTEGEIIWYEGLLTDISAKKLTNEKLLRSENRYELAIKSTNAGVWEWNQNEEGKVWWSDKVFEQLGYQLNEIEPTIDLFLSLLHPDDIATFLKTTNDFNGNAQSYIVKYQLKTKSGTFKWFLATAKPVCNDEGEVIQIVGSLIDINLSSNNAVETAISSE